MMKLAAITLLCSMCVVCADECSADCASAVVKAMTGQMSALEAKQTKQIAELKKSLDSQDEVMRAMVMAVAAVMTMLALVVTYMFLHAKPKATKGVTKPTSVHMKYFNLQGAAETLRHVMALGGMEWTETGWTGDLSKAAELGPAKAFPAFGEAQANGELVANMNRGPVMVIDGNMLGQSKTQEKYLARCLGLMGASEIEAAYIDAITEHVRDIKDKYQKAKSVPEDKEKYFAETMPEFMGKLEKAIALNAGSGPALVGKTLSLADLTVYVFLVDFFSDKEKAMASIDNCPKLKASVKAVGENAAVAKYRAGRMTIAT
uniref:GST C-terminal domain-containing protein n=1 Tax=Haptolina brevifila TaxID=156173 RepID=A0A7S2D5I6_9EUKA